MDVIKAIAIINVPLFLVVLLIIIRLEKDFDLNKRTLSDLASKLPGVSGQFGKIFSWGMGILASTEAIVLFSLLRLPKNPEIYWGIILMITSVSLMILCSIISVGKAERVHLFFAVLAFISAPIGAILFALGIYKINSIIGTLFVITSFLIAFDLVFGIVKTRTHPPAIYEIWFIVGVMVWNFLLCLI